ncbi:polysaccharide biosynthesis protein [Allocoleopsis franciscana]|uniref:Putative nucleoside-diphosphate sugar epimerase n=1 Tax=Allocoleopsis franciscana PCC 7113 TaxID=1173027 RepID=K9WL47_9CYAN|nr:nucleoside-diphosphate sugar epimerase/dehydratase [Allocoleopsis franciscana]AFZ20913.1 putative nucleoside-diphosphate sugar epimerase [Allocoleopsis franciscana PCC 7113]
MPKRVFFPSIYRLGQIGLDSCIAWLACSLAFSLRFDGDIPASYQTLAWMLPLLAIPGRLLVQSAFGLYKQIWRLFGLKDAITLFQAITLYSLLLLVTNRLVIPRLQPVNGIPIGVAAIDWSFCLMGMIGLRYARRWSLSQQQLGRYSRHIRRQGLPPTERQRVLLVGAGRAGCQIVQEVQQNPQINLEIVGFVDDDPTKVGRKVEGVPVLGKTSQMSAIAQSLNADEVLISMPSANAAQIRKIVNQARGSSLKLKVLPGHGEIIRDRTLTPQARDIQIQDILGRPEIKLDFDAEFSSQFPSARSQIYQQTVLVTGAGGSIGSEICRQLARLEPKHLLLVGRGENSIFNIEQELRRNFPNLPLTALIADIRHQTRIEQIFKTWKPEIVFHAAAHKHVPLMQHNPTEALENNALASFHLAQLASTHNVNTFVLISTDKAVEPNNFMGLSKRLAELLVKACSGQGHTRFLVVRFGNVLGSRGSVVPIFQEQIARGGPVTVTHQAMTRYFMTTPEASQLVLQSLAVGQSGQTLILDMGQPVNIYNLAEQMIHLAGLSEELDIPIQITGLRPGEKLHESLVSSTESVVSTGHPKIMAVSSQPPSGEVLSDVLTTLSRSEISHLPVDALWDLAQHCRQALELSQFNGGVENVEPEKKSDRYFT